MVETKNEFYKSLENFEDFLKLHNLEASDFYTITFAYGIASFQAVSSKSLLLKLAHLPFVVTESGYLLMENKTLRICLTP
jgi:hypothetical protein